MTSASTEPMVITFHFEGRDMATVIRGVCASIADKEVSWVNASTEQTDLELLVHTAPATLKQSLQAIIEKANCRLAPSDNDDEYTIVRADPERLAGPEGGAFVPTRHHHSSRLRTVRQPDNALAA